MIELGKMAKDKVSGFQGIVTGRAQYLTGCTQYVVIPPVAEGGGYQHGEWFDEGRLEVVGDGVSIADVAGPTAGGPQRDAPRR